MQVNDLITYSGGNGSILIGEIREIREKAILIHYSWDSAWNNCALTIFSYAAWIPKSQVKKSDLNFELKPWIVNNLKPVKVKRYFIKNGEKQFV